MCDELGANYYDICLVYGNDAANYRVKECQWHFKNDVQKKANELPSDIQDLFKDLCQDLCKTTTVSGYNRIYNQLMDMHESCPKVKGFIVM